MNALVLAAFLAVGAAPDSPVLAGLSLSGGARASPPAEGVFNFGLQGFVGLRFGPVRFGGQVRGLFSSQPALDAGGFFTVDLVRVQLEPRLSLALFTGVEVMGRWLPFRAPQWTAVALGVFGVRALGVSLGFAGGAEFPLPTGPVGNGELRLGVELVELVTFFVLQGQSGQPAF